MQTWHGPPSLALTPVPGQFLGFWGGFNLYFLPCKQPVSEYVECEGVCNPDARPWWGLRVQKGEKSPWERCRITFLPCPHQTCQVHTDPHPPAGDPRGHLRLRDG